MIFLTSDHHFSHKNILRYCSRPFATIREHDEELIRRWNEVVKPQDVVWHLGDFALTTRAYTEDLVQNRLNGHIHLVAGGHDRRNIIGFESVSQIKAIKIDGTMVVLCHYPLYSWPGMNKHMVWHLHGHVHNKYKLPRLNVLDVGVDGHNFTPIEWGNVKELIAIENESKSAT